MDIDNGVEGLFLIGAVAMTVSVLLILLSELGNQDAGSIMDKLRNIPLVIYILVTGLLWGLIDHFSFDGKLNHSISTISSDFFAFFFYPVLLADVVLFIDIRKLKSVVFQTIMLICPGMVISTVITGFGCKLVYWHWSIAQSINFGAVVATTDTAAILSILDAVGGPDHIVNLVSGEALFNDAGSLTMMEYALGFATDNQKSLLEIILMNVVVGIALGLALALLVHFIILRNTARLFIIQVVYIFCPFGVFYVAAKIGCSTVLAVVFYCLVIGSQSNQDQDMIHECKDILDFLAMFLTYMLFFWGGMDLVSHLAVYKFTWLSIPKMLAVYPLMTFARFASLAALAPIFRKLNEEYQYKYVCAMTYGSFRGAMSLFMYMMTRERLKGRKDAEEYIAEFGFQLVAAILINMTIQAPTFKWMLLQIGLVAPDKEDIEIKFFHEGHTIPFDRFKDEEEDEVDDDEFELDGEDIQREPSGPVNVEGDKTSRMLSSRNSS